MNLTSRFEQALVFTTRLHTKQYRKKQDVPYVAHLLAVASIVLEQGGDEDETIAALLHDAVEDQGGLPTLKVIRRRFGPRVADIVAGCTDAVTIPKPPWEQRKQAYIAHLHEASASVRLVSLADKLHNARAILFDYRLIGEAVWERFSGGKQGTLWYYRTLINTFRQVDSSPLVDELARVVSEIERLAAEPA